MVLLNEKAIKYLKATGGSATRAQTCEANIGSKQSVNDDGLKQPKRNQEEATVTPQLGTLGPHRCQE